MSAASTLDLKRLTKSAVQRRKPNAILTMLGLAAALSIAGCSTDRPKPGPLPALAGKLAPTLAWSDKISAVQFPLVMNVVGTTLTVASTDGAVRAIDAESGKTLWRVDIGDKLSAGVGSDGRTSSVVTRDGDLIAIADGRVKWRKPLGSRVATAPLVAGERIFVLGIDRAVQAFDAEDGRKLWSVQRPGDPLTLAQGGVLLAFKDTLLVGQGPRLAALDPGAGNVRWEFPIGAPRGANEVERLADLVGPAVRIGDIVCMRSFQAAVGCVNAERAVVVWTKAGGGTDAVAADAELVVGADASDRLTAWRTATGDVAWSSEALQYRQLGPPALFGDSVVYGDIEGTLHWLSRDKGTPLARVTTDGSAVLVKPVVIGSTMVVLTRNGGLYAYRAP